MLFRSVEYHDVARAAQSGQPRAAQQQHLAAGFTSALDLFRPFAAGVRCKRAVDLRRQLLQRRYALVPARNLESAQLFEVGPENGRRAMVEGSQAQAGIECQHAGRQVGEDALDVGVRLTQLLLIALLDHAKYASIYEYQFRKFQRHLLLQDKNLGSPQSGN